MPKKVAAKASPAKAVPKKKSSDGMIKRGKAKPAPGARQKRFEKEEMFHVYIHRIMKKIDPDNTLSRKAMDTMNSLILDVYRQVSQEAASLSRHGKNTLLRPQDVQSAIKLRLPGELCKHALSEATVALCKYVKSQQ